MLSELDKDYANESKSVRGGKQVINRQRRDIVKKLDEKFDLVFAQVLEDYNENTGQNIKSFNELQRSLTFSGIVDTRKSQ